MEVAIGNISGISVKVQVEVPVKVEVAVVVEVEMEVLVAVELAVGDDSGVAVEYQRNWHRR